MPNDEKLVLALETRLQGAKQIQAGATAANNFAVAENKAVQSIQASIGPYQKRIALQKALNDALTKGTSAEKLLDLRYAQAQNAKRIERIENPKKPKADATAGDRLRDALFSSRFSFGGQGGSGGGLQPLVGRALDAFAPQIKNSLGNVVKQFGDGLAGVEGGAAAAEEGMVAAGGAAGVLAGGVVAAGIAAVMVAKAMTDAALASSALTQAFSDLQTKTGGGSQGAANATILSRITGVDAGSGSRSLRERITSDPLAMAIAAQNGVASLPGPFGARNFGAQYQQLIMRLAANPDRDSAMRQADTLGLGQEVNRVSMLSPEMQARLQRTADLSAQINNPEQEVRAAALQAGLQNVQMASDNFKTALGNLFDGGTSHLLDAVADWLNNAAERLNGFNAFLDQFRGANTQKLGGYIDQVKQQQSGGAAMGGAGGGAGDNLQVQQLEATRNLVSVMRDVHRTIIGGGDRDGDAIPAGLYGRNLTAYADIVNSGLVHTGALGQN